jgi:hypothetical protein
MNLPAIGDVITRVASQRPAYASYARETRS